MVENSNDPGNQALIITNIVNNYRVPGILVPPHQEYVVRNAQFTSKVIVLLALACSPSPGSSPQSVQSAVWPLERSGVPSRAASTNFSRRDTARSSGLAGFRARWDSRARGRSNPSCLVVLSCTVSAKEFAGCGSRALREKDEGLAGQTRVLPQSSASTDPRRGVHMVSISMGFCRDFRDSERTEGEGG